MAAAWQHAEAAAVAQPAGRHAHTACQLLLPNLCGTACTASLASAASHRKAVRQPQPLSAPSSPAPGASHPCWQCPRRSWPCHMPRQSLRGAGRACKGEWVGQAGGWGGMAAAADRCDAPVCEVCWVLPCNSGDPPVVHPNAIPLTREDQSAGRACERTGGAGSEEGGVSTWRAARPGAAAGPAHHAPARHNSAYAPR